MGLFTDRECPTCGREMSITTDGFEDYYVCWSCHSKLKRALREKEDLENRVRALEKAAAMGER